MKTYQKVIGSLGVAAIAMLVIPSPQTAGSALPGKVAEFPDPKGLSAQPVLGVKYRPDAVVLQGSTPILQTGISVLQGTSYYLQGSAPLLQGQ